MSQPTQRERAQPPATSQTQTTTQTQTQTRQPESVEEAPRILRLRGADNPGRSVQWAENVVDNEGMGRKSSKVCCIYHRPKAVDESSEESSSSSDSGSDGEKPKDNGCGHGHGRRDGRRRRRKDGDERRPSPNAYERVPKKPAEKKAQ